jgi:hypothetical protein
MPPLDKRTGEEYDARFVKERVHYEGCLCFLCFSILLDDLIAAGVVDIYGLDENGEFLYTLPKEEM